MRHPIHIGLDAHMVGGHETGNETYVRGLIDGMSRLDEDIEVYVYGGSWIDGGVDGRIKHRPLLSASPLTRLTFDLPLRSLMQRIDVIHCTYTAPIWTPCPLVLTVHDISYEFHPEWFSPRDLRVLKRTVPWSAARADRVITVSEVCRREIVETYRLPEEKVVCVRNAAGPAAMPVSDSDARNLVADLGLDLARPMVLAVGNLQPRKNLVRLINAFSQVLADGADADLVLVGPEHYRASLVHDAAASQSGRVHFTGYLTDRQLAACYATATVFAFPSLYEGFGIPALEAMAHGTPVVCSDAGALREVCDDAAMYFDPLDENAIAASLAKVLSDAELRHRLAVAGQERQKQFTWVKAARDTLSVYRGAMHRARIEAAN